MLRGTQHVATIRPTIIIGAGGTGYEVVVRVKARFLETYPDATLSQIKFLVFDTDVNHAPVKNSLGEEVSLIPGQELIQIGGVPVKGILENRGKFPEIVEELELDKLPRLDMTKGAKQVRQLGRLAFFYHFQRIKAVLTASMTDILNIAHRTQAGSIEAINVFIVASVCGGTGGGILIDLAYLTRALAEKNGIPADNIYNTALLVLPEAFKKIPLSSAEQIRANASATLTEIDHFSVYGDFRVLYPGLERVADPKPPFSITYLVDAINEERKTVEDMTQLAPILAEALFLQSGTYLGGGVDSAFDNVATARGDDLSGFIKTYSMVGVSTLRFNAVRMREACALRLVAHMIRDGLGATLPAHDLTRDKTQNPIHPSVRELVAAFLSRHNCANTTLLREKLREIPDKRSMVISLNTDIHDRAERQVQVSRVEKQWERYTQQTLHGTFADRLVLNQRIAADNIAKDLGASAYGLGDQLHAGVSTAHHFLEGVSLALSTLRRDLQREQQAAEADQVSTQKDLKKAYDAFSEAAQAFTFWGLARRNLTKTRRLYSDAYRAELNNQLELLIIGQIFALLEAIDVKARQLLGVIRTVQAALDRIGGEAEYASATLDKNWGAAYVTEENVDSPTRVPIFYDRTRQSLDDQLQTFVRIKPLSDWLEDFEQWNPDRFNREIPPEEQLEQQFYQYARNCYEFIMREESIEKQLVDRYSNEADRAKRLRELVDRAAPFANYAPSAAGQGSEDLDQILVVGVTDKDRSIFKSTQIPKGHYVSTFDEHRISVLNTKHGLPLHALRQYEAYKKSYTQQASRAGRASFLCFRSVEREAYARELFMRSEVLGLIKQLGVAGYYMQTESQTESKEVFLGEDLRRAVEAVVGNKQRQQDLEQEIGQKFKEYDLGTMIKLFGDYLEQPGRQPSLIHNELYALAQSEYDRYRAQVAS